MLRRWLPAIALALCGVGSVVIAQIEGADRAEAPLDSTTNLEVSGIKVDVVARTADAARFGAWREAQRRGWRLLWAKSRGGGGAPGLSDGQLDSIVSGIVIENEQIGPTRYVATLGVLFDRVRAGQILGISGSITRSAPLLVIPVQWMAGTAQSFEARTEWRKAWARFRTNNSPIDYVRPAGTGADPLLLTYAQSWRPGRRWWRNLLDQYGAADVLIPQVRLQRSFPGGPVTGQFTARYGPDNRMLDTFTMTAGSTAELPKMLDEAVARMDQIYSNALAMGTLRPDATLIIEQPIEPTEETALVPLEKPTTSEQGDAETASGAPDAPDEAKPAATVTTVTIQFETPDVSSVSSSESAVRSVPGVKSASTTSLALGGTSVMRVSFEGDIDALRLALTARGFSVQSAGGGLRISRGGQ